MRRYGLTVSLLSVVAFLAVASSNAQAVVVDMNSVGHTSVGYNASNRSGYYGVAMVPGSRNDLVNAAIPTVVTGPPCSDPALPPDLRLPESGLCWQGGSVMHRNEPFALTWDGGAPRRYWEMTRGYVEQFLSDVAGGSGTLTSPYAESGQYSDSGGHAANNAVYGGGCTDFGTGGATCKFGETNGSGVGNVYPGNGCTPSGTSYGAVNPSTQDSTNDVCLTDAQVRSEVSTMVQRMNFLGHTQTGYTPLVVVLLPTGVEACLDSAGTLCSANSSTPTAKFCSYHSRVDVGGTEVAYLVQPWTPYTTCDEPNLPTLSSFPTAQEISVDAGMRLVNPLSQAHLAAITNPGLDGWFAHDGSEINDNDGCIPLGKVPDTVTVGTSSQNPYYLQREFNNTGVMENEPFAPACTPEVVLTPAFVVPSAPKPGDVIDFDGSATDSTLIVPKAGYAWNFGDGTTSIGPSVEHSYAHPGTYSVKLTVTDRGGNVRSLGQTLVVQGTGPVVNTKWLPRMQLLPQGLHGVLHDGVAVQVTSNKAADGIATLLITRGAARRAHIKAGHGPTVVVGRGTVSGIVAGTTNLHLHIARAMAKKLRHVKHLKLTVRMNLFAGGGQHVPLVAAGSY